MESINELIARWDSGDGKPYKGRLIDWDAYEAEPDSLGCMCAQGQLLHKVGGWTPERLRNTKQSIADAETAKLLNISRAHAVLLRQINDSVDGAPSVALTDPEKVLGSEWSKLLDFWWHIDALDGAAWQEVGDASAAASAAAWDAARDAAWAATATATTSATIVQCRAAGEIQGASIFRADGRPFFFLSMFGFASPDEIPARPANYGVQA